MKEKTAGAIYDVLVRFAGANEADWETFAWLHVTARCDEYRFMGALGFGGKFWCHDWRVSAYPEDITLERQQVIDETNAALAELRATIEPEVSHG